MKAYLHYDAFFEMDMPDIAPNSEAWQIILRDKKKIAEADLSDDWILDYQGTIVED